MAIFDVLLMQANKIKSQSQVLMKTSEFNMSYYYLKVIYISIL